MVSEKKIKTAEEIKSKIEKYSVIGLLDMFNLPAKQLQEIRNKMRGKAIIKMAKKRILKLVFKKCKKAGIKDLNKYFGIMPAVLFSNENPFKLARIIEESKTPTFAKPGDIAINDIVVRAGPTDLPPGPIIGELQKVNIPTSVQDGKIAIAKDTIVAKKGEKISEELANILVKLNVKPMEIGLNLLVVWENGIIYTKDTLFKPLESYINEIKKAIIYAFNITTNIEFFTKENIHIFLSKAQNNAISLALNLDIPTKETINNLLLKAYNQSLAIQSKVK